MAVWRHNPHRLMEQHDGLWWTLHDVNDPDWIVLGFAPTPTSAWRAFWHHVHHGRLMLYPWPAVLVYAWRHRNRWAAEPTNLN